jgi:hypothetical protein
MTPRERFEVIAMTIVLSLLSWGALAGVLFFLEDILR